MMVNGFKIMEDRIFMLEVKLISYEIGSYDVVMLLNFLRKRKIVWYFDFLVRYVNIFFFVIFLC